MKIATAQLWVHDQDEALEFYTQALEIYDAASMRSEGICIFGMKAVAHLRIGDVPGALGGWILDPQGVKPGNHMASNALSGEELQAVIAYLQSLK